MTGAILLVLFIAECLTLLSMGNLLTLHVFIGMLLIGPVGLKTGSTLGPGLARLDVPVELVFAQLVGGEQVPDPGFAGVGGAQPRTRRPARLFPLAAGRRPVPARPGL